MTPSQRTSSIVLAVTFLIPGVRPVLADPAHIDKEQILQPSGDVVEHDTFGAAVAISGNTMVIGGFNADGVQVGAGAAFIFEKAGDHWVQTARLFAPDGKAEPVPNNPGKFASDAFGSTVAISGDTVVVGAPQHTHPGLQKNSGALYVFQRVNGEWVQQAELFSPTPFAEAFLGAEAGFGGLGISGDTIVAGDEGAFTVDVFTRDVGGWAAATQFTVADDFAFVPSDVAIDGDTVVVGSPGSDAPAAVEAGAAYVFRRVGADWVQQAELTAADAVPGAQFGWTVRLDGHLVAVGANRAPGASDLSGAAYVFAERGQQGWSQQAKLQSPDGVDEDDFGSAVAVSGHTLVVGARNHAATGTTYVFRARDDAWPEIAALTASDGIPGGDFGVAVAVRNDVVLAGADGQHPPVEGYAGGEAYVFRVDP